jgi:CheY-like chemotaxis protein
LTLVRRLVALHGGTVTAASDGPGKGSTFTVRLPLAPADDATTSSDGAPPARPSGRRRILVVDDNADSADSLALLLGIWDHDVQTANDGPAAVRAAEKFRPDVVFLDLGLPRMNGFEVARELRKLPGLAGVALVALSGYGREEDRKQTRQAGFVQHLVKPVDPDEIKALLGRLPGA